MTCCYMLPDSMRMVTGSSAFCRQMEALFRDNVRNTWRPRALARMTAALQRKQGEIAALGTPPAELTLQHVWDTVTGRVDLEALCTSVRTHVRAAQPGSVCCRLWLPQ